MKNPYRTYDDAALRAAYAMVPLRVIRSGPYRGMVRLSALKDERRMIEEAVRRGHEYPCTWLGGLRSLDREG